MAYKKPIIYDESKLTHDVISDGDVVSPDAYPLSNDENNILGLADDGYYISKFRCPYQGVTHLYAPHQTEAMGVNGYTLVEMRLTNPIYTPDVEGFNSSLPSLDALSITKTWGAQDYTPDVEGFNSSLPSLDALSITKTWGAQDYTPDVEGFNSSLPSLDALSITTVRS